MGSGSSREARKYQKDRIAKPTRLEFAMSAMFSFFTHTFSEKDGFALATFNNSYHSAEGMQTLGNGTEEARAALLKILAATPSGQTALYDGIAHATSELEKFGSPDRPQILIVITDGEDTASRTHDAWSIGSYVRSRFTEPYQYSSDPKYVFVVGVGPDISFRSLKAMGPQGNFHVSHVRDFDLLQIQLAAIAYEIVKGQAVDVAQITGGGADIMVAEMYDTIALRDTPLDVMFLLDISGSMCSRDTPLR